MGHEFVQRRSSCESGTGEEYFSSYASFVGERLWFREETGKSAVDTPTAGKSFMRVMDVVIAGAGQWVGRESVQLGSTDVPAVYVYQRNLPC